VGANINGIGNYVGGVVGCANSSVTGFPRAQTLLEKAAMSAALPVPYVPAATLVLRTVIPQPT